jgi:tetratricopeptide (TPR) repeat protein
MTRNLITIILVAALLVGSLVAGKMILTSDDPMDVETMDVANQLYKTGKYSASAQVYEQLLSRGEVNSALYYNLGNAYYSQGDFGRAILNYQRALQLTPRDPDVHANLEIAREQSGYTKPEPANPFESLADLTSTWLTMDEIALLTLGIWLLLGFTFFSYRQLNPGRLRTIALNGIFFTILLFLVAGVSFGSRLLLERTKPDAVIITNNVSLSSNPGSEKPSGISLNSGAEVKLIDIQGEWAKLSLSNDLFEGWIPLSSVETVSVIRGGFGSFS